jgi:tetratricopeptide (TPR) repeat protein
LAGLLADRGENAPAIEEYRQVLAAKPDYSAARLALAGLLAKSGDAENALTELRRVSSLDPRNPNVFEQIGDLEAGRKHAQEARAAYQSALDLKPDRTVRKRIANKLSALE